MKISAKKIIESLRQLEAQEAELMEKKLIIKEKINKKRRELYNNNKRALKNIQEQLIAITQAKKELLQ